MFSIKSLSFFHGFIKKHWLYINIRSTCLHFTHNNVIYFYSYGLNCWNRRYVLNYGLIFRWCGLRWHEPIYLQWPITYSFSSVYQLNLSTANICQPLGRLHQAKLIFGTNTICSPKSLFRNWSIEKVRII